MRPRGHDRTLQCQRNEVQAERRLAQREQRYSSGEHRALPPAPHGREHQTREEHGEPEVGWPVGADAAQGCGIHGGAGRRERQQHEERDAGQRLAAAVPARGERESHEAHRERDTRRHVHHGDQVVPVPHRIAPDDGEQEREQHDRARRGAQVAPRLAALQHEHQDQRRRDAHPHRRDPMRDAGTLLHRRRQHGNRRAALEIGAQTQQHAHGEDERGERGTRPAGAGQHARGVHAGLRIARAAITTNITPPAMASSPPAPMIPMPATSGSERSTCSPPATLRFTP